MVLLWKILFAVSSRNHTLPICFLRDRITYWVRTWAVRVLLVPVGIFLICKVGTIKACSF